MSHRQEESNLMGSIMQLLSEHGLDYMSQSIRLLLNEAMKIERSTALSAAPFERNSERRGYANGFKPKTLKTRMGEITFEIPQVRGDGVQFYPSALERGVRSERALKLAVAEMYVQGVSTRKVTDVMQKLCGLDVSSSQVSQAAALLDTQLQEWRTRALGEIPYLLLDARYEKIRHGGVVVGCALLIAIGVDADGRRSVLGVSVSLSEAEVHWREFVKGLQDRGMHGIRMITSDSHAGLKAALAARLSGVPWQRCQFHLQQNAQAYVPRIALRKQVAADLRAIFEALDRGEADRLLQLTVEKYKKSAPDLSRWVEENIHQGLTVFAMPAEHRKRLRTTNMLERINKEVKRRTRVATLFPNEASLLRLASAILMEISEDWISQAVYLNMEYRLSTT